MELAIADIDPELEFEASLIAATDVIRRRVTDVWNLLSALGPTLRDKASRPLTDSDALARVFEPYADRLVVPPAAAARMLRAITLSLTHPMIAGRRPTAGSGAVIGRSEPADLTSAEIVHFFLNGVLSPSAHVTSNPATTPGAS
jgi:hypothetical protein